MVVSDLEPALLRGQNPFRDRIVRGPWSAPQDAPGVHAEAGRRLERTVRQTAEDGRSRLCLVVGESGAGKSHLLARLRRQLEGSAFFVFVDPYVDGARPHSHLRLRLVDSLWDEAPEGDGGAGPRSERRPLERFIDELLGLAFTAYVGGGDLGPLEAAWRSFVQDVRSGDFYRDPRRAELAPWFVRLALGEAAELAGDGAIAALVAARQGDLAGVALDWLRGEDLDPEDLARLGLPPPGGTSREERARDLVAALASVVRGAGPLVVCFDQTESLPPAPGTNRPDLGGLLELCWALCRRARNLVLIVTCLGEVLRAAAPPAEPHLHLVLPGLDADEARALVSARVGPAIAPRQQPYPGYPFQESFFQGLGVRRSAREVLLAAAREIDRVREGGGAGGKARRWARLADGPMPHDGVADRPAGGAGEDPAPAAADERRRAAEEADHWRAVFDAYARAAAFAPPPTDEILAWALGTLVEWRAPAGDRGGAASGPAAAPAPAAAATATVRGWNVAWHDRAGRRTTVVFASGKDGRSFLGRLRAATMTLDAGTAARALVVRRGEVPDRWESAPRALEAFGRAGGALVGLDDRSAGLLATVRAIRLAADAGDVRKADGTPATTAEVGAALAACSAIPPLPILEAIETGGP